MHCTILGAGVGASHFLPHKPDANIYPPGFLITWGEGEQMMFECAEGVRFRLEEMGVDYASVQHVAVSHPHTDHYAFVHFWQAVFLKRMWGGEQFIHYDTLRLYAPAGVVEHISALTAMYFPPRSNSTPALPIDTIPIVEKGPVSIGSATLRAWDVYHGHGHCPAVAYRLETPERVIAYSGDTGDCDGLRAAAQGADLFICEASAVIGDTQSATGYGHLDPHTIGEIAKTAGARKLLLFHYTGKDEDSAVIRAVEGAGFEGEVIMGKDMTRLTV